MPKNNRGRRRTRAKSAKDVSKETSSSSTESNDVPDRNDADSPDRNEDDVPDRNEDDVPDRNEDDVPDRNEDEATNTTMIQKNGQPHSSVQKFVAVIVVVAGILLTLLIMSKGVNVNLDSLVLDRQRRSPDDGCTCGPGMYVETCDSSTGASCAPCRNGTFSPSTNGDRMCTECSYTENGCPLHSHLKSKCTLKADIVCECNSGYEKVLTPGGHFNCLRDYSSTTPTEDETSTQPDEDRTSTSSGPHGKSSTDGLNPFITTMLMMSLVVFMV